MELASRFARTIPKSRWTCSQCRQTSNLAEPRYSTKSATASLADDLLRPIRRISPGTAQHSLDSKPARTASDPANNHANSQQRSGDVTPIRTIRRRAPRMTDIAEARTRERRAQEVQQAAGSRAYTGAELERQFTRRFAAGDVYSPHDLNGIEQSKWSFQGPTLRMPLDIVDRLGVNLMDEYKNFGVMHEFLTPGGRILHSNKTGLRPKNQRRLARAVRRASGLGLIPKTYPHPELLMREKTRR